MAYRSSETERLQHTMKPALSLFFRGGRAASTYNEAIRERHEIGRTERLHMVHFRCLQEIAGFLLSITVPLLAPSHWRRCQCRAAKKHNKHM